MEEIWKSDTAKIIGLKRIPQELHKRYRDKPIKPAAVVIEKESAHV